MNYRTGEMNELKTLDKLLKQPLLVTLVLLSLVTAGAYLTYYLIELRQPGRHIVTNSSYTRRTTRTGVMIPQMPEELDAALKARSLELRAVWRDWAHQHKDAIVRMFHSSDIADCEGVYNALPDSPVDVSKQLVLTRSPTEFTWNREARVKRASPELLKNPQWKKWFEEPNLEAIQRRHKEFAQYHDFSFSESVNQGTTTYLLWITGRVTKETHDSDSQAIITELAPRFDFIK